MKLFILTAYFDKRNIQTLICGVLLKGHSESVSHLYVDIFDID